MLDQTSGFWISIEPRLDALLGRLEALSSEPAFQVQRELALGRALRPYWESEPSVGLSPLPEELALAKLYLYADYYPDDGQFSLIEQLRDRIEVHISQEEREWLDPLRHSSLDLVELLGIDSSGQGNNLVLQSLGDGRMFKVDQVKFSRPVREGQVFLTRLLRHQGRLFLPGTAVLLSRSAARSIFGATDEERRHLEAAAGTFELGQWDEFTKRYGYLLMWNLARARLGTLLKAEGSIQYQTANGKPFLYAVAVYEHHAYEFLVRTLHKIRAWQAIDSPAASHSKTGSVRTWIQRARVVGGATDDIVARISVTATQLWVECDSQQRLDNVKHTLAATFGFSLHFRGESTAVPTHSLAQPDVAEEEVDRRVIVVQADEEFRLLTAFLESVYLDWADRPSPALEGKTPRHAAAAPDAREKVERLISAVEQNDLALRRTGRSGYDYNRLRAHVGLSSTRPT